VIGFRAVPGFSDLQNKEAFPVMRPVHFAVLGLLLVGGCGRQDTPSTGSSSRTSGGQALDQSRSLAEARKGVQTKLVRQVSARKPLPVPPPQIFRTVSYSSPAGKLAAYLTPDPKDGKKHPAIIWITGGDCSTIDDGLWKEAPPSDDQTASAFRKAGIIMMFPTLRGGNQNPGFQEGFFGEVDDVRSAADFLAKQDYIDPERIYLGGHSTGGTLVLLTAECSRQFRAVFSFGPVDDIRGYGAQFHPFDTTNPREFDLRAPGRWLHSIRTPVFVLEGSREGNLRALEAMARISRNPKVHFFPVAGANHFDILVPTTRIIAEKILRDGGPKCNIAFTSEELNKPFEK
jgi:acetyl esterase/lipase